MRVLIAALCLCLAPMAWAGDPFITLASTTSTHNSGLYDYLLPQFTADTGITVHVISVGTGQAIKIAQNGDADALLVHHRPSEDAFVADGYGIERRDVMYNDFILIGPATDPAQTSKATGITQAFDAIAKAQSLFISRGDDSGTHKREREIWAAIPQAPQGDWYREIGAGMGAALNMASASQGYTLSDRGTWLAFANKGDLRRQFSGDPALFNPYGLILTNPAKHPHTKIKQARIFSNWMTSPKGQAAIAAFTLENQQLFCPNAYPEKNKAVICPAKRPNQ